MNLLKGQVCNSFENMKIIFKKYMHSLTTNQLNVKYKTTYDRAWVTKLTYAYFNK